MSKRLSLAMAQRQAGILNDLVESKDEAFREAKSALGREWQTARDETAPLAEHAKRRRREGGRGHDETARVLTLDFLDRVRSEDLIIEPLDPARPAAGLRIVDVRPQRAYEDARAVADQARRERDEFAAEYGAMLAEAEAKAAVREVQTALKGPDPEALREALTGIGVRLAD